MAKAVVLMDLDDFEELRVLVSEMRFEVDRLPSTAENKNDIDKELSKIEKILHKTNSAVKSSIIGFVTV
jgi:CMP-2-keto-3-deoxyoctulosonic acid synthetase